MDKSLDEVGYISLTIIEHSHLNFLSLFQIVAASRVTKHPRRGAGRRAGTARAQVLGTAGTPPATKARIATTTKGSANISPQPVEKIVVSNLPSDVNEAQVKVRQFFL
jgi:hypothetical protein